MRRKPLPCPMDEHTPAAYSAVLDEELTAIRTAAMRVELVTAPSGPLPSRSIRWS
ncbi:hypothetical protein [Sinorhizobium meliloti]|uniref:hypothetical protein n=1 Tax=Rhizobium meliloti TaxID=382 RepID=UPI0030CC8CD9